MFYGIEKILGRPLSQNEGFRIQCLCCCFNVFATFNDLKDLGLF